MIQETQQEKLRALQGSRNSPHRKSECGPWHFASMCDSRHDESGDCGLTS